MTEDKPWLVILGSQKPKLELSFEVDAKNKQQAERFAMKEYHRCMQYVPIVRKKVERAGLTQDDIDVIDSVCLEG